MLIAFFWFCAATGAALAVFGCYLLTKRIAGRKTSIRIPGVGELATTSTGIVVLVIGAALIALCLTGMRQHDDLRVAEARFSQFLTPSALRDAAMYEYYVVAPHEQQRAIRKRAHELIDAEFSRVTRDKSPGQFVANDFAALRDVASFLQKIDQADGAALYYLGEQERLLSNRSQMRERFFRYLTAAPGPNGFSDEWVERGYFTERTAFIHHLLANDFLCEALNTESTADRGSMLREMERHVLAVRQYTPMNRRGQWFAKGVTTISTDALAQAALNGTASIPKPTCPMN